MTGSENDKKMELLHRAVGQIEGVAFFQSEVVRDLLLGAAEDITDGVESMKKQMESMEAVGLMQTTQIESLMKDKDDLLTENGKLREAGERIATSAAPPRNDMGGVPAGDPSGGSAATSAPLLSQGDISPAGGITPCAGEALGAEDGCEYCKNRKTLQTDGTTSFFIDGFGGLAYRTKERTTILVELKFCPMCGRKL